MMDTTTGISLGFSHPNGRLIDFHTHILPQMDDGSRSVQESWQMLAAEAEQGVFCIAVTPHFYADSDTPEAFLQKRKERIRALREKVGASYPILLAGAEMEYFSGMTVMEELPQFCLEKTNLLLLEMPFAAWSTRVLEDVLLLQHRYGIQPILAHIERYLDKQPAGTLEKLLENGILIQANASFFLEKRTQHRAVRMLEEGRIHLLGSDCHNMSSRPPRLGECYDLLRVLAGTDRTEKLIRSSLEILRCGRYQKPFS